MKPNTCIYIYRVDCGVTAPSVCRVYCVVYYNVLGDGTVPLLELYHDPSPTPGNNHAGEADIYYSIIPPIGERTNGPLIEKGVPGMPNEG